MKRKLIRESPIQNEVEHLFSKEVHMALQRTWQLRNGQFVTENINQTSYRIVYHFRLFMFLFFAGAISLSIFVLLIFPGVNANDYETKEKAYENMTIEELQSCINDVYAKYDYPFTGELLKHYQAECKDYKPDKNFSEEVMSQSDLDLIDYLASLRNDKKNGKDIKEDTNETSSIFDIFHLFFSSLREALE